MTTHKRRVDLFWVPAGWWVVEIHDHGDLQSVGEGATKIEALLDAGLTKKEAKAHAERYC